MLLAPDNFFYFITLFTISVLGAAYLFFSYYRNSLLLLNAFAFVLLAIRCCTEYYLPQIEEFTVATNLAIFHNCMLLFLSTIIWYCAWFYIRPFRHRKQEPLLNNLFLWGFLIAPLIFRLKVALERTKFTFHEVKLDGYWKFTTNMETLAHQLYDIHTFILSTTTIIILGVSIKHSKQDRLQKGILFLSFIIVPTLYFSFFRVIGELIVPNVAGLYMGHLLIISWFVSEYRLFTNSNDELTQDLLNSISDLAIFTDLNWMITNANQKAKDLFLHLEKQSLPTLLSGNSNLTNNQVQEQIQNLIHQDQKALEINLIDTASIERIFTLKVAPFKKGSTHVGYTVLLDDLTELRAQERQLAQLNETKDRLFAIVSHDLRKPALAFRGISKKVNYLIQQQAFERLNKLGSNLEKAAFALNSLLDNLLHWALRQRDILPYHPEPIPVKEATKEIYQLFIQIAEDKGLEMTIDIDPSILVLADPQAFSTIIRNLVDNAIKYTPVGGSVQVNANQVKDGILLQVVDTGVGIKKDLLDTIFNLEKAASKRGTEGETGSGLGLTLVRDLVTLNKGTITVYSEWNKGTTFEVILPSF